MFIVYTPPLHVVFGGSFRLSPLYWLIPIAFGVLLLVWASIRVLLMRKGIEQSRVKDIKGLMMCAYKHRSSLTNASLMRLYSPDDEDDEYAIEALTYTFGQSCSRYSHTSVDTDSGAVCYNEVSDTVGFHMPLPSLLPSSPVRLHLRYIITLFCSSLFRIDIRGWMEANGIARLDQLRENSLLQLCSPALSALFPFLEPPQELLVLVRLSGQRKTQGRIGNVHTYHGDTDQRHCQKYLL